MNMNIEKFDQMSMNQKEFEETVGRNLVIGVGVSTVLIAVCVLLIALVVFMLF